MDAYKYRVSVGVKRVGLVEKGKMWKADNDSPQTIVSTFNASRNVVITDLVGGHWYFRQF